MSSCWKKPFYTPKQQEKNWLNLTFACHDQFCHCDDPWLHFLILLNKTGSAPKPEEDIKNIKCLLTGDTHTEEEDNPIEKEDETGFIDGELERLFQEDEGEGTSTTEKAR